MQRQNVIPRLIPIAFALFALVIVAPVFAQGEELEVTHGVMSGDVTDSSARVQLRFA